ncbi:MAG: CoA transferase, partial [Actinomycetota bacterium]
MSSAATQPGPLTGVRVLDLGQVLASPFAGYLLSNLGAEVIKIEPPDGEWLRQATGGGLGFSAQNGGKKMVALDLHRPDGAQVLLRLAAGADVFLEGFAPGTADAMGLGFDAVRAQRPDVVYASLSAFGAEGPYGGRPAFDHVVQAASGIMESTGFPDQPPTKVGSPYVDYSSGLLLAFAVLAGLRQRDLTDDAVQVDITM